MLLTDELITRACTGINFACNQKTLSDRSKTNTGRFLQIPVLSWWNFVSFFAAIQGDTFTIHLWHSPMQYFIDFVSLMSTYAIYWRYINTYERQYDPKFHRNLANNCWTTNLNMFENKEACGVNINEITLPVITHFSWFVDSRMVDLLLARIRHIRNNSSHSEKKKKNDKWELFKLRSFAVKWLTQNPRIIWIGKIFHFHYVRRSIRALLVFL